MSDIYSEILSKNFHCLSFLHFFKIGIRVRVPLKFTVAETGLGWGKGLGLVGARLPLPMF